MPYLPVSLELIAACLDDMVDSSAVLVEGDGARKSYFFSAFADTPEQKGTLNSLSCVSCGAELQSKPLAVFCGPCMALLRTELNALAEKVGWPAQAVYEHEILYLAASLDPPLTAEKIAGHSRYTLPRYTLRNMRRKLDRLTVSGYAEQGLDEAGGRVVYHMPDITYPKSAYQENMRVIRSYPASIMEEVELRVTRILFALGVLVVTLFVLAVFHVPYPLLLLLFVVLAPAIGIGLWRHRLHPEED
jgi:hypothetical protein